MKKFETSLRASFYIFSTMNGWDSALIVGMLSYGATMATFENYWLSLATAVFTTGAVVYVIDVVSTLGILPTMEAYKRGGSQAVKKQYLIVFAYLILLSGISLGISVFGRDYITEVAIPTPPPVSTADEMNTLNTNHSNTLATYDKTISDAEKERRKAEKNAGSPWLRMMADKGNKAAISALNEARKKAGAEYTATIQTAQAAKLQATLNKDVQTSQINASAMNRDAMALESTINKRHLISGFLMWVAIGSLLMMWITALTIVALDASDGELDGAIGNDGIIENFTPPHPDKPTQRGANLNASFYAPMWSSRKENNEPPPVTNKQSSYSVATQSEINDREVLELAIKRVKADRAAWQSKLVGNDIDDANNLRQMTICDDKILRMRRMQDELTDTNPQMTLFP